MSSIRPSLNALRALEATARLRSMSAAAEELMVTHGAISRHIKSLEDIFGMPLLLRHARSIEPTPEGSRLAGELSRAFALISASVAQLRPGPLTLSCSATFMMYWLIPRIGSFHEQVPNVELQFNMNYDQIDFVRDEISVAIRISKITPPKDVVIKDLITESIGPVCSPEYLKASKLNQPQDLQHCQRLSPKTRSDVWREWMSASEVELEPAPSQSFEHFYLLIQAAICGLGVAIVPKILVLDDLRSGKLVAPFGFVPGPHKLVLWIAPHLRNRPDTKSLVAWLMAEFKKPQDEHRMTIPGRTAPRLSRTTG